MPSPIENFADFCCRAVKGSSSYPSRNGNTNCGCRPQKQDRVEILNLRNCEPCNVQSIWYMKPGEGL